MAIENWHEIFIRLSYPQFKINELSKYLDINSGTLRQYINNKLKLTKIKVYKGQTFGKLKVEKLYTTDNVQFLHIDVNYMKNVFNQNYFIYICNLITDNNERINIDGKSCREHYIESFKKRRGCG